MSDTQKGPLHGTSDAGVAGTHDATPQFNFLVGPTTSDEFNTARFRLEPVACFRVDDIRFAFNSSFVATEANEKNDIRAELKLLVDLLLANPESPLSVFGHADPVGTDEPNKQLSGRRATVIYALLIFNSDPDSAVKLWKGVATAESWGSKQKQAMQSLTGLPAGTADQDLFKAYMQKLAPADLKLTKKDFIAQGADPNGKGDFQGCGEFNPILIFGAKRNTAFESVTNKTPRNDANAPNRRVMILLFQKGTKVDPALWPCPAATSGSTDCRKRFWSDGEKRRSTRLPDTDRQFDDTKDTFACRFYHRLLTNSPCEKALTLVRIRLFDPQGRPLPAAPCLIAEGTGTPRFERASGVAPANLTSGSGAVDPDKEDAFIVVRATTLPVTVKLKWSRPKPGDGPNTPLPTRQDLLEFEMEVTIDIPETDANAAALTELKNLGYVRVHGDAQSIRTFQNDYKSRFPDIVVDGTLNAPTVKAIKAVHEACDPALKAGNRIALKR